jgi:metallo-beta-lactamase family protein
MCSGGRIVNYLKQFLPNKTADIFFGLPSTRYTWTRYSKVCTDTSRRREQSKRLCLYRWIKNIIKANAHTISGYSAHADQKDLLNFVKRMRIKPKHILIVHGDEEAKATLKEKYQQLSPDALIEIGQQPILPYYLPCHS